MATLTVFYDQINNELSNAESFLVDFYTTEKDLHGIYSSEDPLMPITVAYNKSIAESSMGHFVDSCSIEKMTEEKKNLPPMEGEKVDDKMRNLVQWHQDNCQEGDGLTLQEIGDAVGLTRERVRQIEAQALKKLRHPANLSMLNS